MERAKGNQYLSNSIFNEKNTSSVEEKSVFSIMEDAQKSVKKNDNVNRRQNDAAFFKEIRLERDIGSNIDTENSMSVATNSSIENSLNSNIGRRGRENAAMSDNTSQMGNGMSGGVESKITLPSHFLQTTEKRAGAQFVPAGQSTQMIIGASGESDFHLLSLTQRLYQQYDLKRVFYSAYVPLNDDPELPAIGTAPPLLREHRLYQADWLLRYYGFQADELLSSDRPNFNTFVDPKCDWALRHLEHFPVEVETASYATLLRVPGIGPKSASRITYARKYGRLTFESLKKMGVVLKRAHYFITCGGKQMYHTPIEEAYITRQLIHVDTKDLWKMQHANETYSQMTLADFGIG